MFTGIVQAPCRVLEANAAGTTARLVVDLGDCAVGLALGASVAINGTCLTAVRIAGREVAFDVILETMANTNLGDLAPGSAVNVERSLSFGDEVGGHILSGHVATAVTVAHASADDGHRTITVAVPQRWMCYLMPKGFVALNGASLTIQELDRRQCTVTVSLIPETLARTTFDAVRPGDRLNLEVDAQTQAVVDTVRSLLPELLREQQAGAQS